MTCESVLKQIPLYSYGELTPDEEDRLEQHLHECAACARERERQSALSAALIRRQLDPPPALLENCREDLLAAIQGGAGRIDQTAKGPWRLFLEALNASWSGFGRVRQPVGALALIAIGFFAARIGPGGFPLATKQASLAPDSYATVRSIQRDPSGSVQIAYDETRRHVLAGRMEDPAVQSLLLAAVVEENPAVRVESVGLLTRRAMAEDVREALLDRLANDTNPGVRIKALEGLKGVASDPDVRKRLAQVLVADDNPAIKIQVVDVLMAHRDDSVVGVLQGLVQREGNNSVRLKVEKALKDMNASIGTF